MGDVSISLKSKTIILCLIICFFMCISSVCAATLNETNDHTTLNTPVVDDSIASARDDSTGVISKNNDSNNNNKISNEYKIFFNKCENKENINNIDDDKCSINTYEIDEEENEENNDNYKNKNQNKNSSCELIILDDNNIFESVKKLKRK